MKVSKRNLGKVAEMAYKASSNIDYMFGAHERGEIDLSDYIGAEDLQVLYEAVDILDGLQRDLEFESDSTYGR